tara:strand:+ start:6953 stop:9178 length:2226 start_codon:yes stop_codon:yes gene_type:complete
MVVFPLTKNKAPAVPKGTNWQEFSGSVNTAMFGIMIPQGVFIIDIDTYKGVSTDDIESALGCKLDWDSAELQKTLNGGMHYAFAVPSNFDFPNGSDLLGVIGFDTRSSGKGYIASGEGYENLTFHDSIVEALQDELPALPGKAITLLTSQSRTTDNNDTDDLLSIVAANPHDISYDEVKSYVELLSDDHAADQNTWLKVGMALWHQLGEEGWALFDKFSQRCEEKYDEDANRRRWESFSRKQHTNPVTFASVIDLAGGAKAKSKIIVQETNRGLEQAETLDDIKSEIERLASINLDQMTLDVTLKKIQQKYVDILGDKPSITSIKGEIKRARGNGNKGEYVEDYVFMTATGEYMNRETKAVCGPRSLDVAHNRDTPLSADGEKQSATVYANDIIEIVENSMYFPAAGEIFTHAGLEYINTYKEPQIKLKEPGEAVQAVMRHFEHLLPDEKERDILINYLAYNVQNPGVKMNWSIVLQGVQGDGKSLLAEMMQIVMGYNNVRIMNVGSLESNFTGWATGQCMTFIEELKLDNTRKYEVLNNLKPYISNPVVEEHKKGKDPRSVINTTNYFALTNFKDAIPIDANDRRYCILFSQWQRKDALEAFMHSNPNYYSSLYEIVRNNAGELRKFFLDIEISNEFLSYKRAPATNAKLMMEELSKSSTQVALEDALEEFSEQIKCDVGEIDVTQLGKIIKNAADFDDKWEDFPKTKALKNALLNLGYEPVGRRRTNFSGENYHYVYAK